MDEERSALQWFVDTVEATGGVFANEDGTFGCYADEDWIDLADAYLAACAELGRTPMADSEYGESAAA